MLEYFCIFLQSGFILWKYEDGVLKGNPVNDLIKSVILEERSGLSSFSYEGKYVLKWTQANDLDLIFVAVYQQALSNHLTYIDDLLEAVKSRFAALYKDIRLGKEYPFDTEFNRILRELSEKPRSKEKKVPAPYAGRSKKDTTDNKTPSKPTNSTAGMTINEPPPSSVSSESSAPSSSSSTNGNTVEPVAAPTFLGKFKSSTVTVGGARVGRSAKSRPEKKPSTKEPTPKKTPKPKTTWDDAPGKPEDLNFCDDNRTSQPAASIEDFGVGEKVELDKFSDSESSEEIESQPEKSAGGLMSFFSNMINKELTEKDLSPVMKQFSDHLKTKNVAYEIAEKVCESISQSLVGKKISTFSRVNTIVREAMDNALTRILTPKRTIDILREARAAQSKKVPYTICFVGVNGVGKSTSLSKVCSWLLQNGFKVMIAACDTFRAGAIEQLEVHGRNLEVNVFNSGYGKDPSGVCTDAINYAKRNGIDIVLIDTAGRMQDNHVLMDALAKLVGVNNPDLVLFVGEALVGNEAVDQLVKFNRALEEFGIGKNPRGIDGIFLTKFDTVDEKVGAAISMVYTTGQPIVFVGIGQKYSDLKVLNVDRIVSVLLKGK